MITSETTVRHAPQARNNTTIRPGKYSNTFILTESAILLLVFKHARVREACSAPFPAAQQVHAYIHGQHGHRIVEHA